MAGRGSEEEEAGVGGVAERYLSVTRVLGGMEIGRRVFCGRPVSMSVVGVVGCGFAFGCFLVVGLLAPVPLVTTAVVADTEGVSMVTASRYWHHSWARRWCGMSRLGSVPAVRRFGWIGNRNFRR